MSLPLKLRALLVYDAFLFAAAVFALFFASALHEVSPGEIPKPLPLERLQLALLAVSALAAIVAYGKRFPSPVDPVVTLS